ncbi:MAG: hypothetical protein OEV78_05420 [Spirochaetia bacterium]|nr:hypothetical protein [Spirochaetia bacterium]
MLIICKTNKIDICARYVTIFLWISQLFIFSPNAFAQEAANKSDKQKFQIQIEDELEKGIESSDDKDKETEDIIISGQDEQLIRIPKSDTSFISPTNPSSIRWLNDKDQLDKDGKTKKKNNEKSGDIVLAYGMYDNSYLNLKFAKSDKFGLYQLRYIRDDIVSEGYNGIRIINSGKSSDDVNVTVGSRILPRYLLMVNAKYIGDNVGFQNNASFSGMTEKWGSFIFQNNIKPDDKQVLNIDLTGNYLQSNYIGLSLPESKPLYFNSGINANWIYIFQNKISIETNAGYDYTYLNDIDKKKSMASSIKGELLFHFPLVRTRISKSFPWQLDLTAGGGGFYKDLIKIQPIAKVYIDSKLDIWNSRLGFEKSLENLKIEESYLAAYYEKPVFYQLPLNYWHGFWDNSFLINSENTLKLKSGYKQYEVYYNPRLDSNYLYYQVPIAYKEIYGHFSWEYSFFRSFLLETSFELNFGLNAVNMRPVVSFLAVLNYNTEKFDAAISFKAVGKRNLDNIVLSDYYLTGLSLKYWLTPSFSLMASGENLLNQKYTEYYPYQNSGIKIFAGCYIKI